MIGDRPSPAMQAILDRIAREDAGLPDSTTLAPALGRAQTARSHVRWRSDLPAIEAVRDVQAAGGDGQKMRCRLYLPVAAPDRTLLFLHGGGWAFCDIDTHDDLCRRLALDSGAAVLACDYRLAPEHPYPAALADCSALLRAALAGDFADLGAGGRVSIAGDSAGANLALAVMLPDAGA